MENNSNKRINLTELFLQDPKLRAQVQLPSSKCYEMSFDVDGRSELLSDGSISSLEEFTTIFLAFIRNDRGNLIFNGAYYLSDAQSDANHNVWCRIPESDDIFKAVIEKVRALSERNY